MLLTPNEKFSMSTNYSVPRYTLVSNVYGPGNKNNCQKSWNKTGCNEVTMTRMNPLFGSRQISHTQISKSTVLSRKPPPPDFSKSKCKKQTKAPEISSCKTIKPDHDSNGEYKVVKTKEAKCTLPSKLFTDPYSQRGEWTGYTIDTRKPLLPVSIVDVLNIGNSKERKNVLQNVFKQPVNVYENEAQRPPSNVAFEDEFKKSPKVFIPDSLHNLSQPLGSLTCVNNIVAPMISNQSTSQNLIFER